MRSTSTCAGSRPGRQVCFAGRQIPPFTSLLAGRFEECRSDLIRRRRYPFRHRSERTAQLRPGSVVFVGHFSSFCDWDGYFWSKYPRGQAFTGYTFAMESAQQRSFRYQATWLAEGIARGNQAAIMKGCLAVKPGQLPLAPLASGQGRWLISGIFGAFLVPLGRFSDISPQELGAHAVEPTLEHCAE